ncbi:hypothetical protein [Desulfovibrio litoralis]|uniref:Uncharacterized protein n=1 Tax=Desulfovibrio litoralis DSM 11393 TaxID=1121455 RepID=A0A1M7SGU0_9BACT|nr:hypothetical protein [Desulfovibrio litoralis]SHN57708.1 hypothetical protein SAMN02745728_00938 [Desulfovibrio litoralis DSM 11393]
MQSFFIFLSLFSLINSTPLDSSVVANKDVFYAVVDELIDYDALSEAVILEYYNGEPEKQKKHPGLYSRLASALGYESLNFTLETDPKWNCEDEEGGWTADTWEYALDPSMSFCPLPPRFDPKGEIFVAKRGKSIYIVRNGVAKRLGPATFNNRESVSRVIVADIDFDGEPEFFLMLGFGTAGEFYGLVDANGSDAPLKRLFAPYLEEVNYFDFFISKQNMIFDGLSFDKEKRVIRLGSGGINSFTHREFTFKDGKYFLSSAGRAVSGKDNTMTLAVDYTVNTEGKAIKRSATTPGDEKAPPMLLLRNTNYFGQNNATLWNNPECIALRNGDISVYPDGVKEYEDLLNVPFSLGGKLGTIPANTWVQLEDVAWIEEKDEEQNETNNTLISGMWCKVSFPIAQANEPNKKNNIDKNQKSTQNIKQSGWIPCSNILLNSEPITVTIKNVLSSLAQPEFSCQMDHFYIDESQTNAEGEWLHLGVTQSIANGWILRKELEGKIIW